MPQDDKIPFHSKLYRYLKAAVRNKKFLVFLIFVLVSATLWFLNALEKEYVTDIDFKIKFENLPYKGVAVKELPDEITVTVKGHGYNLLKYKYTFSRVPVVIDLSEHKLSRLPDDRTTLYCASSKLVEFLMKRFDNDVTFVEIKPDTLYFKTVKASQKVVPVVLNLDYVIDAHFKQSGKLKLMPDSVVIYGDGRDLAKIDSVETEEIKLGMVSASVQRRVPIKKIDNVTIEPGSVQVTIAVEKCVDKVLQVAITPSGFPDDSKVLFIPEEVELSCKVSMENYEKITAADFKVVAEYSEGKLGIIPIKLSVSPDAVSDVKLQRQEVRYIIEKK